MTQPAAEQIAPISRRAIGYLIDAVIAAGLAIVLYGALVVVATVAGAEGMLSVLVIGGPIVSLLLLGWFIVYTLMQSGTGSIGMRAQGLRLVTAADQAPLGFGRTLLRNVVFGLASSIVVGYFTPLFDGSGRFQGWHDRVAGSLMVDARAVGGRAGAVSADVARTDAAASVSPPTAARPAVPAAPPALVAAARPAAPAAPSAPSHPTPSRPAASAPASPAPPPGDSGVIAFVPGITQDPPRPAAPAATEAPAAAPTPAATTAVDADSDLDVTVVGQPAVRPTAPVAPPAASPSALSTAPTTAPTLAPAGAPTIAPTAAAGENGDGIEDTRISIPGHRLVFTWDDGTRVSVSRRTVFGRNPAAEDGVVIVPVRDETLSLSKTHFEAAAEPSGGWVMDRHSTNGMTLVRDGQRIACPAGQRVPVRLGDAIEIGDRIVTVGGYA